MTPTTRKREASRRPPVPRLHLAIVDAIAGLRRDLFGGYRPERHYMRGPGPKWREKHGVAAATAADGIPAQAALA